MNLIAEKLQFASMIDVRAASLSMGCIPATSAHQSLRHTNEMLHEGNPIAKPLCWPPSKSFRISERMYSLKFMESDGALLYVMRSCNFRASL